MNGVPRQRIRHCERICPHIHCWPLLSTLNIAVTCVPIEKSHSDLSLMAAHSQSLALTFGDTELEARFERWLEASTASWELAGSWALVLVALLWAVAQWRLFGAHHAVNISDLQRRSLEFVFVL